MLIISKTDDGVTVHLSEYELKNLIGEDRWPISKHVGKDISIKGLENAVRMAESIAYTRKNILSSLNEMAKKIEGLPIDQFASK